MNSGNSHMFSRNFFGVEINFLIRAIEKGYNFKIWIEDPLSPSGRFPAHEMENNNHFTTFFEALCAALLMGIY
ncbi:MAG: hypothetical protein ACRDBG_27755, partial [Waterburya sp.]